MKLKKELQRVSNKKPFTNNYNWEGINYPSKVEYWKRFKNNQFLSVFCILKKSKYV